MRRARPATRMPEPARPLTLADAEALRATLVRFGAAAEDDPLRAIDAAGRRGFRDARALLATHDALLFALAYPGSMRVWQAASRALRGVAREACELGARARGRERRRLDGTGIAGCEVTAAFGHALCAWLARTHGPRAEITGFGDDEAVAAVLALCLPAMDAELLSQADGGLALVDAAKGEDVTRLAWLLARLRGLRVPEPVRERLFESMQPFVTLRPAASSLSRTFARAPCAAPFVHRGPLRRHVDDPSAAIREPVGPAAASTAAQRRALLDLARATLAMLARETDPITWPSEEAVTLHDLGRGASVALYPMHPARRFALDSHTGYLLMKNGVPVGYGGGWPFLATCRHGTNVFAPFRGGESSWMYARVLALYRERFAARRFVIEPYQFGAGNREGLLSGAFWFYYRLGFRPVDRGTASLARTAFARMGRGERPSLATLRALTGSDLALDVEPSTPAQRCEPADVSLAVSRWIASAHSGDRRAAQRDAVARASAALDVRDRARWPRAEREAFDSLALAVGLIDGLAGWDAAQKSACVEVMRAKGRADDAPYFRALVAHPRLAEGLATVARLR